MVMMVSHWTQIRHWKAVVGEDSTFTMIGGSIIARLTPEEESAVLDVLDQMTARTLRQCSWQVVAGIVPEASSLASGIVTVEQANLVQQQLTDSQTNTLTGLAGQWVMSESGATIDRAHGMVDGPGEVSVEVYGEMTGFGVSLRTLRGMSVDTLCVDALWLAHDGGRQLDLKAPARNQVVSESSEDSTTVVIEDQTLTREPGATWQEELKSFWHWTPRGAYVVPAGKSLVLTAPHPKGQAVLVFVQEGR